MRKSSRGIRPENFIHHGGLGKFTVLGRSVSCWERSGAGPGHGPGRLGPGPGCPELWKLHPLALALTLTLALALALVRALALAPGLDPGLGPGLFKAFLRPF